MPSDEAIERITHASREIERFAKIRLAEADSADDVNRARQLHRNAKAARLALEAWPRSTTIRALTTAPSSSTPREHRSALTWRSTAQAT